VVRLSPEKLMGKHRASSTADDKKEKNQKKAAPTNF
jgi:hypothetical protein